MTSPLWQSLARQFSDLVKRYGYAEIRTPVFEDAALFKGTAGETSDIVSKEMYEFKDKGGREVALKPEGTAPAIRAVVEHNLCPAGTHARLFYQTACYRYNRPTRGRLRELHQFGCELLGSSSPIADAEVIEIVWRYLNQIGLKDFTIRINSIGKQACRDHFSRAVLDHVAPYLRSADPETAARINKNPMGMLDSKDPVQQEALVGLAPITHFLEPESAAHFEQVQALLTEAGVAFQLSPGTVRGLDYYNDLVFEVDVEGEGGLSITGGGRYDGLVKRLGGQPTPCVGFGIGVERVIISLMDQGYRLPVAPCDVFLIQATPGAGPSCRQIARELREAGLIVELDVDARSLKSQLRQADKRGATYGVILGEDELQSGLVTVKTLASGEQTQVKPCDLSAYLLR